MADRTPQPMLARPAGTAAMGIRAADRVADRSPRIADDADPNAVVDQILKLLSVERFQTARGLAAEAMNRFPKDVRVRRVWGIFDRHGKATVSAMGALPSAREEYEWLKNPPDWARGKWVALVDSEAVAAADTLDELMEAVGSKEFVKKPLAVHVDA